MKINISTIRSLIKEELKDDYNLESITNKLYGTNVNQAIEIIRSLREIESTMDLDTIDEIFYAIPDEVVSDGVFTDYFASFIKLHENEFNDYGIITLEDYELYEQLQRTYGLTVPPVQYEVRGFLGLMNEDSMENGDYITILETIPSRTIDYLAEAVGDLKHGTTEIQRELMGDFDIQDYQEIYWDGEHLDKDEFRMSVDDAAGPIFVTGEYQGEAVEYVSPELIVTKIGSPFSKREWNYLKENLHLYISPGGLDSVP